MGAVASALWWRWPSILNLGPCDQVHYYQAQTLQVHGLNTPGIDSQISTAATLIWKPVATDENGTLYNILISDLKLTGLSFVQTDPSKDAQEFFVLVHPDRTLVLYSKSESKAQVLFENLRKEFVQYFSFQTYSTRIFEQDGLGRYEVEYSSSGRKINKRKLHYVEMHRPSPIPSIIESHISYEIVDSWFPRTIVAHQKTQQSIDPSGEQIEIRSEATLRLSEITTVPEPESQSCQHITPAEFIAAASLGQESKAFAFDVQPPRSPEVSRPASEILIDWSKDSDNPTKELDELTERLTSNPAEINLVIKQLKKLRRDEDKSALLISAIANVNTTESHEALIDLIDYYLSDEKWRLAIRVIRSQQLSEAANRAVVMNLLRIADETNLPQSIRQAALLATGSTAALVDDSSINESLRTDWAERINRSSNSTEKAELLSALGNLADPASVPFLVQLADNDPGYLGDQAVEALRLMRTSVAEDALVRFATEGRTTDRRKFALQSLAFAPLSESACSRLIPHFKGLLQQFGSTRQAERLAILTAVTHTNHKGYATVRDFLRELSTSKQLTDRERDYLDQIQLTGFKF
jgi:hypothetical protein